MQTTAQDDGVQDGTGAAPSSTSAVAIDRALNQTPMINPPAFGLNSIVPPDIGHLSASLPAAYNKQDAVGTLNMLNQYTQNSSRAPPEFAKTNEFVQWLLDSQRLPSFKFKRPVDYNIAQQKLPAEPLRDALSPFSKLILDNTDIDFQYESPQTPNPKDTGSSGAKSLPTPMSHAKPEGKLKKHSIDDDNDRKLSNASVVVSIAPTPPVSAQRDEYIDVPDQNTVRPKRRKLDPNDEAKLAALHTKDGREEIVNALVSLEDLLSEVFEAEDSLEPDTSGEIPRTTIRVFNPGSKALSAETHLRLYKAMEKCVKFDKLHDIPSDRLRRLQKLCEAPIIQSQSSDMSIEEIIDDPAKLVELHDAVISTTTLLETMSGQTVPKDLCSEEGIQLIPTVLNNAFDNCVIPIVQSRPDDKDQSLFAFATSNREALTSFIDQIRRILQLLTRFLSQVDVSENVITAIEFMAAKLIFVENAPNDKDSAIGCQKFESVRREGMDVLAKIFSKYPDQRPVILDEILVSLEKLPSTRQGARQFKLLDGKSIQLFSALVMLLVQTTALQGPPARSKPGNPKPAAPPQPPPSPSKRPSQSRASGRKKDPAMSDDEMIDGGEIKNGHQEEQYPLTRLSGLIDPLYNNAVHSAQYITKYIVQRAMTSTKTGDQPYRNLLDLFTEDLLNVLGSMDWPGSELLLRVLASQMVGIADHDKSTTTAKNMALEILGWMGSSIAQLTSTAEAMATSLSEDDDVDQQRYLKSLFNEHANRALYLGDLVVEDGPFQLVLEHLQQRDAESRRFPSARGYFLAQWGKAICQVHYQPDNEDEMSDASVDVLCEKLGTMLSDTRWLETYNAADHVSAQHARFAYTINLLNLGFCKAFDTIVRILLSAITSDQAKVRSRSLKSVVQMLERDPMLLDRNTSVMALILRCASDSSPMVRDSALSLIAKCITLRPALQDAGCRAILACSDDPTVGVKKRCIGLMRDIYLQTSSLDLKVAIAENLIQRLPDHETSVATIAHQALEDIWFNPFHQLVIDESSFDSATTKVAIDKQVELIVGAVEVNDTVPETLETFLRKLLSPEKKGTVPNFQVCRAIVRAMFERLLQGSFVSSSQAFFRSMTIFAKANARLFAPEQLHILHPYIGNLSTSDDLLLFRSVVVIYRCVLPYLSTSHNTLLKEVQNDLFKSVSKLARTELNEVMACLWTINGVLKNTDRLVKLAISVLRGIHFAKNTDFWNPEKADVLGRVRSYIRIAGCVGKHCDLEKYTPYYKQTFPDATSGSVAGMMVDFIIPFTSQVHPLELRVMALESMGGICQTWPAQFSREDSRVALTAVFNENNPSLHNVILKAFLEFFSMHEGKTEKLVDTEDTAAAVDSNTRFGTSMKASDNDGAAAIIAQNYLRNMIDSAFSKESIYALTAIELIASVNRQGLIHPKECAGVLVSLETSPDELISKIAYDTHLMLHSQHESMFDREYMRAVQEAFCYQRDIIGDSNGATAAAGHTAKLAPLFSVVKTSSPKYQRKFLTNFAGKANFDIQKLNVSPSSNSESETVPEHILLTRFICHNLAFFEYAQISELMATIAAIERIVSTTGSAVSQLMETIPFFQSMPSPASATDADGDAEMQQTSTEVPSAESMTIEPQTLRRIATASGVLMMLWETRSFLRRLYGINHSTKKKLEGKENTKELHKAPVKVNSVTGDKLFEQISALMTCVDDAETMLCTCRAFAELLSVDDEIKVDSQD